MNNNFFIKANLITNYKPNLNINANFLKKNKKQKFCKNFLMYLLLFKYNKNVFIKNSIHIKKQKKKVYTILRSPYRHKLARHQIYLNRYEIYFSCSLKLNKKLLINNYNSLINLLFFLKKFNNIFESNLIFINSLFFSLPIKYNNIFYLRNVF